MRYSPARLLGRGLGTESLILATGSAASLLVATASTKVISVLSGTQGLGFLAIYQGWTQLLALVVAVGTGVSIVRFGSQPAIAEDDAADRAPPPPPSLHAWRVAGYRVLSVPAAVCLLAAVVLPRFLGQPSVSDEGDLDLLAVVGGAVAIAASGLEVAVLNTQRRILALVSLPIVTTAVAGLFLSLTAWQFRPMHLQYAAASGSLVSWGIARWTASKTIGPRLPTDDVASLVIRLRTFGVPYVMSGIVGTGAQLALPSIVLLEIGLADVGRFRAAVTLSIVYVNVILTTMGQSFLPRLASALPEDVPHVMRQQWRTVLLLGVGPIVGILTLSELALGVFYSHDFVQAAPLLRCLVMGDVLRLSSWIMSYAILARESSRRFLCLESIGGGTVLITASLGLHWNGLVGCGYGLLIAQLSYFLLTMRLLPTFRIVEFRIMLACTIGLTLLLACSNVLLSTAHVWQGRFLAVTGGAILSALLARQWGRDTRCA